MRQWKQGLLLWVGVLVVPGLTGCMVISNQNNSSGGNGNNGDHGITVNSGPITVSSGPININIDHGFVGGATKVSEEVHKEFRAEKVNSLRVVDQIGSIEIAPAEDGNTIHIEAKKEVQGNQTAAELKPYLSKIQPTARLEGDALVVESNIPRNAFPTGAGGLVHYVITVPHRLSVDLHTNNSPITVRGVTGGVTAHTSNGAIELFDVGGALKATTANSPITLDRATIAERLTLETANGEITCDSVRAAGNALKVTLNSSNAPIHFVGDVSELSVQTANGGIEAEPTDHLTFENGTLVTTNSPITFTVPSSFSASMMAQTVNATIRTSGMGENDTDNSRATSRTLVMGKQYAPVRLETTNGDIKVEVKR